MLEKSPTEGHIGRPLESRNDLFLNVSEKNATFIDLLTHFFTTMSSADKYKMIDAEGMRLAISEARAGYQQGGIPIGSVLLLPNHSDGTFTILGSGHNKRIQKSSPTLHGEISALENAGRLPPQIYRKSTIVRLHKTLEEII